MNLEFLPEARGEFAAAVEFYEDKEPGLGGRFKNEIGETCSTIVAHPLLWREREGGFRRVFVFKTAGHRRPRRLAESKVGRRLEILNFEF
jgi:hypothetical protein